jgi:hypothetical protein
MCARYHVHRSDLNARSLRHYLEQFGAQVDVIQTPLDWLVHYLGQTAIVEVKSEEGDLNDEQWAYVEGCRGFVRVLRDEQEADELLQEMRVRARKCGETAA